MPPQNPITRIEQVARDLGRLAEELGDYVGPDARRALLHWQAELRWALDQLQQTMQNEASQQGLRSNR
jgi:hypothetical protein